MTTSRAAVPFVLAVPAYLTGYTVGACIARLHSSGARMTAAGADRPRPDRAS